MITIWIPVIYVCLAQDCNFFYRVDHHTERPACLVELEQKKEEGRRMGRTVDGICVAARISPNMFSQAEQTEGGHHD